MKTLDELIDELVELKNSGVEGKTYPIVQFRPAFSEVTQHDYIMDVTYNSETDEVIIYLSE